MGGGVTMGLGSKLVHSGANRAPPRKGIMQLPIRKCSRMVHDADLYQDGPSRLVTGR